MVSWWAVFGGVLVSEEVMTTVDGAVHSCPSVTLDDFEVVCVVWEPSSVNVDVYVAATDL